MTTVINETDASIIEKLDFEYIPPCERGRNNPIGRECELPATWKATVSCCGRTILFCDKHKQAVLEINSLSDYVCGADYISVMWERL